uniref:Uncharacterized protein n=1 Tax=Rhizophagus irregularis (strain DAOM 181602 / DAOM 197198 / MUCL 43194) TaxID=747089 RepID=U9T2U5_RHIID
MSEEIDNIFQDGWMKILSQRRILNHVWTLVEDYDYAREEVSSAMIELVCLMALLFRKYEINLVENPNESENSPAKYYQLTVSDEMEEILSEGLYTSTLDDVMSMNKHGESYLDYTWNGSFRDVCKHVHAVHKQRVLPSSNKNLLIYNGSVAYQEIIRLYNLQGNLIFNSNERPTNHINEPFRPNDQILVH